MAVVNALPSSVYSCLSAGFSTELDKVKSLPYCETETFEVKFDPRGANLDLGEANAVMPIQVRY